MESDLLSLGKTLLEKLCIEIENRCVGSKGNLDAVNIVHSFFCEYDFESMIKTFDCIEWHDSGSILEIDGKKVEVFTGPFSPSTDIVAKTVFISSLEELRTKDIKDRIVILKDEIVREQVMPKNFVFYNPDHHKEIYSILENSGVKAVVAITTRDPETAGGVYPFPLFEDGDFEIPSVYMSDIEGNKFPQSTGFTVHLKIDSLCVPSKGGNIIAGKGDNKKKRLLLCAHIDSKYNSPGAIDNATGVITLMLIAFLLKNFNPEICLEIVIFNGEDYYSAPGEMLYLKENTGKLEDIIAVINIDGAGYKEGKTSFSFYDLEGELKKKLEEDLLKYGLVPGKQWYQSDHSIFIQQGVPAAAITSDYFLNRINTITHTPGDNAGIVDIGKVVDIAKALVDFIKGI